MIKVLTNKQYFDKWDPINKSSWKIKDTFMGYKNPVTLICTDCGFERLLISPSNATRGRMLCPQCKNEKRTHQQVLEAKRLIEQQYQQEELEETNKKKCKSSKTIPEDFMYEDFKFLYVAKYK